MKFKFIFFTLAILVVAIVLVTCQVQAADDFVGIKIDEATILKGYTVQAWDGDMRIGITPGSLTSETYIEFKRIPKENFPAPEGYSFVSDILEFDIKTKENYDNKKPLWLQLGFDTSNDDYVGINYDKTVFFYDQGKDLWRELPTNINWESNYVRSAFHLPFAKLAVLEMNGFMSRGEASWYAYKNCDCAASPDYAKGTKLLVTNTDNGKQVVVTINDWGPERDIFPNRVIDLDLVAFEKIANPRMGLCNVEVVPYVVGE